MGFSKVMDSQEKTERGQKIGSVDFQFVFRTNEGGVNEGK